MCVRLWPPSMCSHWGDAGQGGGSCGYWCPSSVAATRHASCARKRTPTWTPPAPCSAQKRQGDIADMGSSRWWAHLLHVDRRPRSGWLQGWQPVERLNRQTHAAAACSLVRGQARLAGSNGGTRGVTTRLAKLALEDPVAPKYIARPR